MARFSSLDGAIQDRAEQVQNREQLFGGKEAVGDDATPHARADRKAGH